MTLASSIVYHLSRAESSQRKPTLKSERLAGVGRAGKEGVVAGLCLQGDQQDGLRKATPGSPAVEKSLLEERLHPAVSLEGSFAN